MATVTDGIAMAIGFIGMIAELGCSVCDYWVIYPYGISTKNILGSAPQKFVCKPHFPIV